MGSVNVPKLIIADEPTTALDVTVQAQVIDLLEKMNTDTGSSFLFISHNIALVSEFCSRVIVMYAGRIVEEGSTSAVFRSPTIRTLPRSFNLFHHLTDGLRMAWSQSRVVPPTWPANKPDVLLLLGAVPKFQNARKSARLLFRSGREKSHAGRAWRTASGLTCKANRADRIHTRLG